MNLKKIIESAKALAVAWKRSRPEKRKQPGEVGADWRLAAMFGLRFANDEQERRNKQEERR